MRILFVADGRSPIAMNWINYFLEQGTEVHLASTFACTPDERLAGYTFTPVAFSSAKGGSKAGGGSKRGLWGARLLRLRTLARQWLGPLTLPGAARRLKQVIDALQPDLVHAMRIPYEGMLAALAGPRVPLLVSVWGNDFTLHAVSNPWMAALTRRALRGATALHTDCYRDQRLAFDWGFAPGKPAVVLPGAGGIQPDLFYPGPEVTSRGEEAWVINPRGFRAYVRSEAFLRAIPLVLARRPQVRFLCATMAGEPQAQRWVDELGIVAEVELLPPLPRSQMADLFRRSRLLVSPSVHDGTPNTLLEGMACGCLPVAGDIESLREWITPGVNGLLVDPNDSQALAEAMLTGLESDDLYQRARAHNLKLVEERASYPHVMRQAFDFYASLVK